MELTDNQPNEVQVDELTVLKKRADKLGITYSNNIGVETLRSKINAVLENQKNEDKDLESDDPQKIRQAIYNKAMKLVRCQITNLDPKKKDIPGEIITVANPYIGTVRKYIPFGEATIEGYHIPYCIYEFLKNRKFLSIKTRKGSNGQLVVETSWAPEFAITVLPQLTKEELKKLAAAQKAAGSIQ